MPLLPFIEAARMSLQQEELKCCSPGGCKVQSACTV